MSEAKPQFSLLLIFSLTTVVAIWTAFAIVARTHIPKMPAGEIAGALIVPTILLLRAYAVRRNRYSAGVWITLAVCAAIVSALIVRHEYWHPLFS